MKSLKRCITCFIICASATPSQAVSLAIPDLSAPIVVLAVLGAVFNNFRAARIANQIVTARRHHGTSRRHPVLRPSPIPVSNSTPTRFEAQNTTDQDFKTIENQENTIKREKTDGENKINARRGAKRSKAAEEANTRSRIMPSYTAASIVPSFISDAPQAAPKRRGMSKFRALFQRSKRQSSDAEHIKAQNSYTQETNISAVRQPTDKEILEYQSEQLYYHTIIGLACTVTASSIAFGNVKANPMPVLVALLIDSWPALHLSSILYREANPKKHAKKHKSKLSATLDDTAEAMTWAALPALAFRLCGFGVSLAFALADNENRARFPFNI